MCEDRDNFKLPHTELVRGACEDRDNSKLAHTELVRGGLPKWIKSSTINGMSVVLTSNGLQLTFGRHRRHGTFLSRMVRR
jgi:hypothetical protein